MEQIRVQSGDHLPSRFLLNARLRPAIMFQKIRLNILLTLLHPYSIVLMRINNPD
jgi:hypothetical protein